MIDDWGCKAFAATKNARVGTRAFVTTLPLPWKLGFEI
jgi:hypothetical protein